MIKFFNIKYSELSKEKSEEIYSLRKTVFKDRLNWAVSCTGNLEFDQYDTPNTTYIVGVYNNVVLCSLRFIETKYPTMITGTFLPYFKEFNLPAGKFIEASRLFIDKSRLKESDLYKEPICAMLFLAKINYARNYGYAGIYAIVSHPMYLIFKKSGWKIIIVEKGISEKKEKVYLIFMPVDEDNQKLLVNRIFRTTTSSCKDLISWPLVFNL